MMNEFYYLKGFAVKPSGEWVLDTEIEIDWNRLLLGRGEGSSSKKCIASRLRQTEVVDVQKRQAWTERRTKSITWFSVVSRKK